MLHIVCINKDSPGHTASRQSMVSEGSPVQLSPPWAGTGFVHDLDLVLVPGPQVDEQFDQASQSVQPP